LKTELSLPFRSETDAAWIGSFEASSTLPLRALEVVCAWLNLDKVTNKISVSRLESFLILFDALFNTLFEQLQSKSKYYIMHSTLFCAGWLILLIIGEFHDGSVTYTGQRRYKRVVLKWMGGKNGPAGGREY
jgi:hypothetical protein